MILNQLRKKIDAIDKKILELINSRAKQVMKVSVLKKENNLSTYASEREKEIIHRLQKENSGPIDIKDVENIFVEVLSACRNLHAQLSISYLGPQGTFSHLAASKIFGKKPQYFPCETIQEVFESVEKGMAEYGVVPIENTTEGVVNYTLDMFFDSALKICAEVTLNVNHYLLGDLESEIKRIYSHPVVFPQCRRWLMQNYPKVELIAMPSTAKAALEVKKDKNGACIGNKILSSLYELPILASSIQDSKTNYTRFLIIAKNDSQHSGDDKTSVLFSIKDKVGALYDILNCFKLNKINLTKIESRPSKRQPWEYYFFVDFEGHRNSPIIKKVLNELEKKSIFVKVLGSYPQNKEKE